MSPSLLVDKHALLRTEHPEVHTLDALELVAREECVDCGRDLGRQKKRDGTERRAGVCSWVDVANVELYGEVCELFGRDCGE